MCRLPPLTALPSFEATARLGSVTLAAQERGRTHGAVCRQIGGLSEGLGVALSEKAGHGPEADASRRAMLPAATEALGLLATAARTAQDSDGAERLHIGVSMTFASRWFMQRLARSS